ARLGGVDGHQRPIAPVASNRRGDRSSACARAALHEGEIFTPYTPRREHRLQSTMNIVSFGYDEQARGIAVQPVHDSRPPWLVAARAAPRQRLGKRPSSMSARRVHDDAGWLVDDQQILVLVRDT